MYDLLGGGTADDGVVHQQHVLAAKLEVYGVQLLAHGFLALRLAGHDEGAPDVAVLDKTLAILDVHFVGHLQGRGATGVGDGDDHIDVVVRPLAQQLACQLLAHAQAHLVHGDAVDNGIRARQVHVLEDAGYVLRMLGTLACMHTAIEIDENRLARFDVAHQFISQHV